MSFRVPPNAELRRPPCNLIDEEVPPPVVVVGEQLDAHPCVSQVLEKRNELVQAAASLDHDSVIGEDDLSLEGGNGAAGGLERRIAREELLARPVQQEVFHQVAARRRREGWMVRVVVGMGHDALRGLAHRWVARPGPAARRETLRRKTRMSKL